MKNMASSQNDGAIIVGLDTSEDLYYTTNVYRKGIPIPRPDCPRPHGTSAEKVDMTVINYISKFIGMTDAPFNLYINKLLDEEEEKNKDD